MTVSGFNKETCSQPIKFYLFVRISLSQRHWNSLQIYPNSIPLVLSYNLNFISYSFKLASLGSFGLPAEYCRRWKWKRWGREMRESKWWSTHSDHIVWKLQRNKYSHSNSSCTGSKILFEVIGHTQSWWQPWRVQRWRKWRHRRGLRRQQLHPIEKSGSRTRSSWDFQHYYYSVRTDGLCEFRLWIKDADIQANWT